MDRIAEYMLTECGDFGRSQFVMLAAFAVINVFASINYYSQTIICFMPAHWLAACFCVRFREFVWRTLERLLTESELIFVFHWCFRCYAEELANKTIDEIREIYSSYPDPSCTPYQGQSEHREFGSVAYELKGGEGRCDRWFYDYDHGYHSMSSEV